jgi:4-oxalocrotonate tautomerase
MPVVTVDWVAGRSRDQKREVAARITATVAEIGGVDPAAVWVVFNDVDPGDWAVGGRLADDP